MYWIPHETVPPATYRELRRPTAPRKSGPEFGCVTKPLQVRASAAKPHAASLSLVKARNQQESCCPSSVALLHFFPLAILRLGRQVFDLTLVNISLITIRTLYVLAVASSTRNRNSPFSDTTPLERDRADDYSFGITLHAAV